jgi:hypothetical protein
MSNAIATLSLLGRILVVIDWFRSTPVGLRGRRLTICGGPLVHGKVMSDLLIAAIIVFLIVVTAFWMGALGYLLLLGLNII